MLVALALISAFKDCAPKSSICSSWSSSSSSNNMTSILKLKEQLKAEKKKSHQTGKLYLKQRGAKGYGGAPARSRCKGKKLKPIVPIDQEMFDTKPPPPPNQKKLKQIRALFDEEDERDDEGDDEGPKAFGPPEIMDNLENRSAVTNVGIVLSFIKEDNVVWDHGATAKGKESEANFFKWLQAYSAHECIIKRTMDDAVFG